MATGTARETHGQIFWLSIGTGLVLLTIHFVRASWWVTKKAAVFVKAGFIAVTSSGASATVVKKEVTSKQDVPLPEASENNPFGSPEINAAKIHVENIDGHRVTFYFYQNLSLIKRKTDVNVAGNRFRVDLIPLKMTSLTDAIETTRHELMLGDSESNKAIAREQQPVQTQENMDQFVEKVAASESEPAQQVPVMRKSKVVDAIAHESATIDEVAIGILTAQGNKSFPDKNGGEYDSNYCEITLPSGQIQEFRGYDVLRAYQASGAHLGSKVRLTKTTTKKVGKGGKKSNAKNLFTIEVLK